MKNSTYVRILFFFTIFICLLLIRNIHLNKNFNQITKYNALALSVTKVIPLLYLTKLTKKKIGPLIFVDVLTFSGLACDLISSYKVLDIYSEL